MLRFLGYAMLGLVVVLLAAGGVVMYLLQDANRFKPELEALIEATSGVPVRIEGDLDWRLWPPVSLSARGLSADYEGQSWQVGRLLLDLDALTLLRDPGQWQVQALTLNDVNMREEGNLLTINQAHLTDLAPRRPAPVSASLTYTAEGQAPVPVTLRGSIRIDPDTLDLALSNARFETTDAEGTCEVEASPVPDPAPAPTATVDDLIPVDMFRSYRWKGTCALDWVQLPDRRFAPADVKLDNDAGNSLIRLNIPRFFGGEATVDLNIDARRTPVRWTVTPTLTNVDSQELVSWLDQRLQWAAPLAYGGTLSFEGNTAAALLASMSGETRFDGGQGQINIAKIRTPLLALASMLNEDERIRSWPEVWKYQRLVGDWRIDHQHHLLDFALDNLAVTAQGDYRPDSDEIDVKAELMFSNDPSLPVFNLDPLLYDLPIPVRCRGTLADPSCSIDPQAAQRIVARVLAGGENNALRAKVEEKIDKQVPEQYRDAARSLLDALGGSANRKQPDN